MKKSHGIEGLIPLIVFSLCLSTVGTALAGPLEKCRLKVGWEDWAPYIYMKDGRLCGPEYSYLERLATKTGCTLEFIEQPWIRSLINLKTNRIDMLYGASHTEERAAFARFSKPYRYEQFTLVSKDDQTPRAVCLREWLKEEKNGRSSKIIGLIRGFYYGDRLEPIVRNSASPHLVYEVRNDDQLKIMLTLGRIDGFIVEMVVAYEMSAHFPDLKIARIDEATCEPMHLMFSLKVSPDIVTLFNAAITELETDVIHFGR